MAISPQVRERNAEIRAKQHLAFPVLADPGNAYARRLGLVFAFPDDLREVYRGFNLVLPDYNGDGSWELPLPTRLVVDAEGTIRAIDADPDYTVRPEPEATLAALRALGP